MRNPCFQPSLADATADPQAVFQFPHIRFTLLTSRLLRVEISPTGRFEDRPTQVFWQRRLPTPPAENHHDFFTLSIETEFFHLVYDEAQNAHNTHHPARGSLQVFFKENGRAVHLDEHNPGILPGTARTLDAADGAIDLKPGLLSTSGWVQIDDTRSLVFNEDGWLENRPEERGYRDLYFLVSGSDFKGALQDYQRASGFPALLPRAFLGNWWSRFWEYTQADVQELVERFQQEQIPLSVFIIDMDWHITKTGHAYGGWTGFTWNRELFPNPPALLAWLHGRNLLTSLNLHPADGIRPHEERYPQAARALGMDPAKGQHIRFDLTDRRFAQVYFDEIIHPLEAEGVDFWWLDWQQGQESRLKDLDPLWWLNHLHFLDRCRDGRKRPVIFSRWGGAGSQRTPIGFSGDSIVTWESLAFQPQFTSNAANVAFGWWSHDIGGHMGGFRDGELYARWVQFGVLSPIFRLHSTKDAKHDRAPWSFDEEVLQVTKRAMQFRHALIPYLYTMAHRNSVEGIPLITPLYYDWQAEMDAWSAQDQYLFGSELMAAPVLTPREPDTLESHVDTWFPPGEWYDFFTGERFTGPVWMTRGCKLENMPLFARAGAIVPLDAESTQNGAENPLSLDVLFFPGRDGAFDLYEDDGVSLDYLHKGGCTTRFESGWDGRSFSARVLTPTGDCSTVPARRTYRLLFRGIEPASSHSAELNGKAVELPLAYDAATRTAAVGPILLVVNDLLTVQLVIAPSRFSEG